MLSEKEKELIDKFEHLKKQTDLLVSSEKLGYCNDKQRNETSLRLIDICNEIFEALGEEYVEEKEPTMYEKLVQINVDLEDIRQMVEGLMKPKETVFDQIFNESMTAYEDMVASAEELYDKSVHKAIEEVQNGR